MHEFADLDLSPEDRAVRDLARQVVAQHVAPVAREIDEEERFPAEAIARFAECGLLGILIPETYGGSGGSMLQYCLTMEEISAACGATSATFMTQTHGMLPILLAGDEQQKQHWLPRIASGAVITSIALTEPGAGSDLAAMRTTARADGDGYVLDGSKVFITNGNHADVMTVFARTSEDRYGGISIFVVETGTPGVAFGPPIKKLGIRGSDTAEVFFSGVRLGPEALVGRIGDGFPTAMGALGDARISTAAQAVGLARGAWDRTYAYTLERHQFDRPVHDFQVVHTSLMRLFSLMTAARLMLFQLARSIDAEAREEYAVESAMAKSFCGDVAMEVTSRCVELMGGYGYTREYEVERFMRDAKITQIYDGTNDINRIVMARQMQRRRR